MKYGTVLIDPPWLYKQALGRGEKAGQTTRGGLPYQAMSLEALAALPVADLLLPDAMLWLWATNSHLHAAFHLLEGWGCEGDYPFETRR